MTIFTAEQAVYKKYCHVDLNANKNLVSFPHTCGGVTKLVKVKKLSIL